MPGPCADFGAPTSSLPKNFFREECQPFFQRLSAQPYNRSLQPSLEDHKIWPNYTKGVMHLSGKPISTTIP